MATEIIRISTEDHAWIMNWGNETDRSAAAIVAYWVKKQRAEMGDVVVQGERNKARKLYHRPYDLTIDNLRTIPVRLPAPFQTAERVQFNANALKLPHDPALLPNLSHGLTDADFIKRRHIWVKCTHLMTWVIGRVAGMMGDEIRTDSFSIATSIKDYKIEVMEESLGVFIPTNETGIKILRLLTINCDDDCESYGQEKEYFSPEDLWMFWGAGYEIKYVDAVL